MHSNGRKTATDADDMLLVVQSIVSSTQEVTVKLSWTDYVSKYVTEAIRMISGG